MSRIRVVAAVVRRGDRLLVTRRLDRPGRPGQWEFPGGKVEQGELEPDALCREIREELDCDVHGGALLLRHRHRYAELDVDLAFYACALRGEPRAVGVAEIAWARAGTLQGYDFLDADRAVLADVERLSAGSDPDGAT